jgi:hypothetical protein
MSALAVPVFCTKKATLLREFARAVSELNRMHSAQVAALVRDEGFQFQEEIAKAGDRKDQLKYAILAHCEEHRC